MEYEKEKEYVLAELVYWKVYEPEKLQGLLDWYYEPRKEQLHFQEVGSAYRGRDPLAYKVAQTQDGAPIGFGGYEND